MTAATTRRYRFLVPPGWVNLVLQKSGDAELFTYVDTVLANQPPERRAAMRGPVVARLRDMKKDLVSAGVSEVVLPVLDVDGWMPPASFAFAPWVPEGGEDPLGTLIGIAAQDASAQLLDIADLVALRTNETSAVDPGRLEGYGRDLLRDSRLFPEVPPASLDPGSAYSRRVVYYIGRADDADAWITATFSIVHAGDTRLEDLNEALVELFDTIMKSVRIW